jgi:hypothetical protein
MTVAQPIFAVPPKRTFLRHPISPGWADPHLHRPADPPGKSRKDEGHRGIARMSGNLRRHIRYKTRSTLDPGAEGVSAPSLTETEMPERTEILCWLHIDDLHITHAGAANHRDLLRIVALVQGIAIAGAFAFR